MRKTKKWISVLLAALLALSVFSVTAAAAEKEEKKPQVDTSLPPVILIDGINATALIRDFGKKDEEQVFPPDLGGVAGVVQENAAAIWDMLDGDFTAESEAVVLDAIFGYTDSFAMNDDGTSKYDIHPDWVYPGQPRPVYVDPDASPDTGESLRSRLDALRGWFRSLFHKDPEPLTEEELLQKMLESRSTYKFVYDWRLDMFEIAAQLRDYIEYMKELTGWDTFSLVGFSEGAAVLNTYLTVYGFEGLESVIWCCGAHNGVELAGQALTGRLHVDAAGLTEYVRDSGDSSLASELLSCFMEGLRRIGVTGNLLNYTNAILEGLSRSGGIRRILRNTVATMPAVWSLVSDKYYEEAKAYIFSEPGDAETYAALIETIDRYHYGVQAHSAELMAQAKAATGKIGVIAKYGLRVTPMIANDRVQSDGVIDVAATSCGATAAQYGATLGEGYVQKVRDGHNHLSPDGVIDASTALYPDYTWFYKDLQHSHLPDQVYDLFNEIAHADHQFTVFEDEAYPQFQVYERIDGSISPMTEQPAGVLQRAFLRVKMFFRRLLERIQNFFTF